MEESEKSIRLTIGLDVFLLVCGCALFGIGMFFTSDATGWTGLNAMLVGIFVLTVWAILTGIIAGTYRKRRRAGLTLPLHRVVSVMSWLAIILVGFPILAFLFGLLMTALHL
jgi:hypothetical protein